MMKIQFESNLAYQKVAAPKLKVQCGNAEQKTNAIQILKQFGIDDVKSV